MLSKSSEYLALLVYKGPLGLTCRPTRTLRDKVEWFGLVFHDPRIHSVAHTLLPPHVLVLGSKRQPSRCHGYPPKARTARVGVDRAVAVLHAALAKRVCRNSTDWLLMPLITSCTKGMTRTPLRTVHFYFTTVPGHRLK